MIGLARTNGFRSPPAWSGALAWKYMSCDADAVREFEELPRLRNALQTGLAGAP